MSIKTCLCCGHATNTTTCDYLAHDDFLPRKCFARLDDHFHWEKGCAYDEANEYMSNMKAWVDRVIADEQKG